MRIGVFSVILLINIIFQSTVLNELNFVGILPNPSFVLVVIYSYLRKNDEALIFAFICGMVQDLVIGVSLGGTSLIYMAVAFATTKTFTDHYLKNIFPILVDVFVLTLAYQFVIFVFVFLVNGNTNFAYYFLNVILIEGFCNIIYTFIIYYPIYFINKKIEKHEKPKRKIFKT
ncbi:MAG: rod shape-determining protein MreD [Lachnospirales bacterium]